MRREDDLVTFAGKILQGDAYKFHSLRMQEQFGRIDEEERPAEIVVVVMLLDFVEVADERHLDGALGARSHGMDVSLESVVFVENVQLGGREEGAERRRGNVQVDVYRREERAELLVEAALEKFQFLGAGVAAGIEQARELLDQIVEFLAEPSFQRAEDFVQKLCESLVAFEVPDLDGRREDSGKDGFESDRNLDPFALAAVAVPVEGPEFHAGNAFARELLESLDADLSVSQKWFQLGRVFGRELFEHRVRNAAEKSFHFDGLVRVVEIGVVERGTEKQPADSHENVCLARIVVADEGGEIAERECLFADGAEISDGDGNQSKRFLHVSKLNKIIRSG